MPDLSITMPIYNEGKSILKTAHSLIKELKKNKIDYEVVLVNNGSKDNTDFYIKKLLKENKRIKRVHVKINQGYGWGIINGLKACTGNYIGWVDGDGQIRPEDVTSCLKYLKTNREVSFCKGVRKQKYGTPQRKFVSHLFDILFTMLFFKFIKDINAKPKIMKKEFYEKLNLKSKRWSIDVETLIKCIKNNIKIGNIEVEVLSRTEGKSNVKPIIILEFIIALLKARFGLF